VQLVVTAVGMTFMLSLLLLAMNQVMVNPEASSDAAAPDGSAATATATAPPPLDPEAPLAERWAIATFIAGAAFFGRRRLVSAAQSLATSTADSLTRLSPAAANWAGGRPTGFDLERPDRLAGRAAVGAAWATAVPVVAAGSVWTARRRERRVAERSYRNTQRLMGVRAMYRADAYQFDGKPRPADTGGSGGGSGSGSAGKGPSGKDKNDTYYPRHGFRRRSAIPRIDAPDDPSQHRRPDYYRQQYRLDRTKTIHRNLLLHPVKGTWDRMQSRRDDRAARRISHAFIHGRPRHPRLARLGLAHRGRDYRGFP
jgi:hypothetical protein